MEKKQTSDTCIEYFTAVEEKKKQQKKLLTECTFALEGQKILLSFFFFCHQLHFYCMQKKSEKVMFVQPAYIHPLLNGCLF